MSSSDELETIEGHVVNAEENLLPDLRPTSLLEGSTPRSQLAHAHEIATALADVIQKQKLFVPISGKSYVTVEGWTMLGSILGVFPVTEWTRKTEDGWEARVVAQTLAGAQVGAAEAQCTRSEKEWGPNPSKGKPRDDYALRSMAQTRATSKALRMPLGFVMQLAGYQATPAEEMPREPAPDTPTGGPKPLDVGSWAKITQAVSAYDEQTHDVFFKFAAAARKLVYGVDTAAELSKAQKSELLRTAGAAAQALRAEFSPTGLPFPSVEDQRRVWASVLEGQELAIPEEPEESEGAQ